MEVITQNFESSQAGIDYLKSLCSDGKTVFVCTENQHSVSSIARILTEHACKVSVIEKISSAKPEVINICKYFLDSSHKTGNEFFFKEEHILGKVVISAKQKRNISIDRQILTANSYDIGDIVVHKKYGIAKFEGISLVKAGEREYDTAKLVYRGGDTLYVPIYGIDYVTKYGQIPEGIDEESLLDKLGGSGFNNRKSRVAKNLYAIAETLVNQAAKRKSSEANVFTANEFTHKFDEQFPYILTEDQTLAIEDCANDLSLGKPMERLICGDVGFGKTEIAMRCCALVTFGKMTEEYSGQACIICPTTLLANQHYKTFLERFSGFDCKIEKITRTTTTKEKKNILHRLAIGEVDILITTHAGFGKDVIFKNLDLLIIDEEQHFGVEQKEKIKAKFPCHCLLLSATPIPRTLQMGLSKIKDISIIATPPFDRILPITQLMDFDPTVLTNAIMREKDRKGRTFFVCPRIADIDEQVTRIAKMTQGNIRIGIAHGQMPSEELENAMEQFYDGHYDVLVTTSIVESGIDISFANTMIIYKAEMFGLSALYQLRGRVGRGKTQSYVYFITRDSNRLTENAKERLRVLASIKSLGEGMKIAMSDLDIRGAGNIVGKEQSGKMAEVGVELYEQMLKEAIAEVRNEKAESMDDMSEIKIAVPFYIPENYIADFKERMQIYREIANIKNLEDLSVLNTDIANEYGTMPQPVSNLMEIIKLKIQAKKLGIVKLETGQKGIVLEFSQNFTKFDAVIDAMQKHPETIKFKTQYSILYEDPSPDFLKKSSLALKWVEAL